jgi:hypothetical protein
MPPICSALAPSEPLSRVSYGARESWWWEERVLELERDGAILRRFVWASPPSRRCTSGECTRPSVRMTYLCARPRAIQRSFVWVRCGGADPRRARCDISTVGTSSATPARTMCGRPSRGLDHIGRTMMGGTLVLMCEHKLGGRRW